MFASNKCLVITIIILDNVLKLWLELIKHENDNATENFYRVQVFQKLSFLVEFSKISKNLGKFENSHERGVSALRVIRAGTRLTVRRSLPYGNSIDLSQSGAAHAGTMDHEIYVLEQNII